jgi:Uma2 family endonuclease
MKPITKITYEEFLETNQDPMAEWVDGEIIVLANPSLTHQDLLLFLAFLVRSFLNRRPVGHVVMAPFQMKLGDRSREPDLIYVANERRDRLRTQYVEGPADLVVEVVSPESGARDRGEKFHEYEAAGVREYWLLDQARERAEFYVLGADGKYSLAPVAEDGVFRSSVLAGFWLRVEWLWRRPQPFAEALQELGL